MRTCIITGSLGLVGSHAAKYFKDKFDLVIGVDNDQRLRLFGTSGLGNMPDFPNYRHINEDMRSIVWDDILTDDVELIIHAAGQPSHDWATDNVIEDFNINAWGTLRMLDKTRTLCKNAVAIFCSTNKVYGDYPNKLSYTELDTRYERYEAFNEHVPVDKQLHSFFGCSKLSADMYFQEYGRNLGLKTGVFRAGCVTGPGHGGAILHGFLSYLVKCFKEGLSYTVYGYGGKQVRDNIHVYDLLTAFEQFYLNPKHGEVYNIGGGVHSNCSVLEAIEICERVSGKKLDYTISDTVRTGDHKYWVSDVTKFKSHYPEWGYTYTLEDIIKELFA